MVLIVLMVLMVGVAWMLARVWNVSSTSQFEGGPSQAGVPSPQSSEQEDVRAAAKPGLGFFARIRAARERSFELKLEAQRKCDAELEEARIGMLKPIDPRPVVLQNGETAFSAIPAAQVELRTVGYRGGSRGVSVRVAKGIYLRQSAFRGAPEKGFVPVARGTLVATDRRLIFAGDQKSAAVPLAKISSFKRGLDGLRFSDGRRTYNFFIEKSHQQQIFAVIAERLLQKRHS